MRYFYNTGWMLGEKVLRLVAALFVGAYVARYLGPSRYGEFNYALSLVTLFSAFSTLGLDQIIVREVIADKHDRGKLMGTAVVIRLCGAIVILGILAIFILSTQTSRETALLILVIVASFFFDSFGVIDYYFQSQVMSKLVSITQMTSLVVLSIVRIWLAYNEADLFWFGAVYSLDFAIQALGFLYFYSKHQKISRWGFDPTIAKELLRSSTPLILASLAVSFYIKSDQVMINWMVGNEASGYYGVAVRLSEMWYFIPVAICGSVFPGIIRSKLTSEDLFKKRMQALTDLMVALSVSISLVMTIFSSLIVRILFGESYSPSSPILSLYIWSGVFAFIGVANARRLVVENLQAFLSVTTALAAFMNIILNVILIQRIGLLGAAIATLIAYSFSGYFCYLFWPKTRHIFFETTRSLNPVQVFIRLKDYFKGNEH